MIYIIDMIYIINIIIMEKLFISDNKDIWYMNCEMNKYILLYKNVFIDYHFIINNSKNIIDINIFILKIIEWKNIKLLNKYDNFIIMQDILHIL